MGNVNAINEATANGNRQLPDKIMVIYVIIHIDMMFTLPADPETSCLVRSKLVLE